MIILGMTLRNFRGVEEREIAFDPLGVTILEGPNEVGKSSVIDALNLLLEYKSSSKHRSVQAVKPVHCDEGPEVILEVESGPYRFTYRKRWLKQPLTELLVVSPQPENETGDIAHDRVNAILADTADLDLWRALRIMQGDSQSAADLSENAALNRALDLAAGATSVGEEETALYGLLKEQYERYWSAKGKEKKELTDAKAKVESLEGELGEVEATLAQVDTDANRLGELQREIREAQEKGAELATEQANAESRWQTAQSAVEKERGAKTAYELAKSTFAQAKGDSDLLEHLRTEVAKADTLLGERVAELEQAPDLEEAKAQLEHLEELLAQETQARQEAEAQERLRQADVDDRRNKLDLDLLTERQGSIDRAREDVRDARRLLAASQATAKNILLLRAALDKEQLAQAHLEAAAPEIVVEKLGDQPVLLNDQLVMDDERRLEHVAEDVTVIEAENILRVTVEPGGDTQGMKSRLEACRRESGELLKRVGADDWTGAVEAQGRRDHAQRQIDDLERLEQEKLRDLTYDDLVARIQDLRLQVETYAERRDSDLEVPSDHDQAKLFLADAKEAADRARSSEQVAQGPVADARIRSGLVQEQHSTLSTQHQVADTGLKLAKQNFTEVQARCTKQVRALSDLESEMNNAFAVLQQRQEDVAQIAPDTAKTMHENAVAVLQDHKERVRQLENEAITLDARIQMHAESGLFDKRQRLQGELEVAAREERNLLRRARAAKRAFEVFTEERDSARQAYVRPLQEAIERLGRIVYGESFQVSLNDDLEVTHRTLDGRTLSFDQLSAGAKEQLGILTRLACATLVAKEGRIPVVLDDTLGNTDRTRLASMGAVLASAGKVAQIIVLTCTPDRFRYVGGATVHRIGTMGSPI